MPTVNVNIPTPPSEAIIDTTVAALQALQTGGTIDKSKWYRVTDASPVPCVVSGASVTESSAFAILEGTSDGAGITSVGGTGTYDLATGTFAYGFIRDTANRIVYIGVDPVTDNNTVGTDSDRITFEQSSNNNIVGDSSDIITFEQDSHFNTVGDNCFFITFKQGSNLNSIGDSLSSITFGQYCQYNTVGNSVSVITFEQYSNNNTVGGGSYYITFEQGSNDNTVGDSSYYIIFEQSSNDNTVGDSSNIITFKQNTRNFVFGNNFRNCTIWPRLNGNKADDSAPIDFITGVTFLYNRTSPWEIRDIDRTAELLFLYVTYGDGSDPEEGWFDPSTDTFTPITSGGVVSVNSGTNISVDNTDPANPIINSLADRYSTTSTTSNTISNGSKTFTVDADLSYIPLQEILVVYNASNHMHGTVTSYSGTTLVVDIKTHTGSGTYTSWQINLDGTPVDAITGSGTTNEIAYFTAASVVNSLPTATYPSITELSYAKGVTSAIQTQLDGKVDENAAITGATKTKITYDAKGLVTSGADALVSRTLNAGGNNTTWASGATYYFPPDGLMSTAYINTQGGAYKFVRAATIKGFTYVWRTTQGAATTVITIQKGATISTMADTAATATVAAAAAAGSVTYASDLAIAAGDFVTIKVVQGGGGNSGVAALFFCEIQEALV